MEDIQTIIKYITEGGVVLLPTDTVYGLAISPNNENAIKKLYQLKSRPRALFLPIMLASKKQIVELGLDINKSASALLDSELIPGAISIVMGFNTSAREKWLQNRQEVAIRIPDDKRLLRILSKTGPLLVTSANKHGSPKTPNNISAILLELEGKPDLIIDGGQINEAPSTIVNCRTNPFKIEREGAISKKTILKIVNNE